ncbi:xylose isomerase [Coccomyxa subellipsoidea C-169]|uniref:Xylose isomerase n=1 Tax=Coccomyxa subellipsoidea (strain C-169) TaxID=574566 RepID=I0YV41_COCSC|nr:xylose isomerase [Coccomyxa subellipsoidea C-169]EIE22260.1 xylose isomerase [Coccomyxa subellipsoidea C-169]|eukprot:XP_005646804.1 xylose isomerase [Coccomyxa subellipsoidea C-169]
MRLTYILVALMLCTAPAWAAIQGECDSRGLYEGEFFPGVGKIPYEGPDSTNPMAFHYYNADEVIMGKPMKEWLRFSVAFWHTMRGDGADPFGSPTKVWPWEDASLDDMELAYRRMRAMFEFLDKLGVDYWCFHDRDIAPEGASLAESNAMLDKVVELAEHLQKETGKKVLWGTAQLFKHPRFMHGAATSPNASVHAYAAAQVKAAMDATLRLGGENYVFWGGREGYHTLLNTDLKLELDNLAAFLKGAVAYKKKIGFKGALLLEPKPQEPTKHQYDWDAATTMGFLNQYGLSDEFKLNVECNHATLAGHSCEHELQLASAYGKLGNIDANTGDAQTGWDTDQFLTDPKEATLVAAVILKQGGLAPGGINFDAKLRRESTDVNDLFYGHISGMDALARGLRNAAQMLEEGILPGMIKDRYSTYSKGVGKKIRDGKVDFVELEKVALASADPAEDLPSARAELYEIVLSRYIR